MSSGLFNSFLRNPGRIGALCPSSRRLSRAMVAGIGVERAAAVAELGPGTGVITREICAVLPENAKLLTIEIDEHLARSLREEFPEVIICNGCASRLPDFLPRPLPLKTLPAEKCHLGQVSLQERTHDLG